MHPQGISPESIVEAIRARGGVVRRQGNGYQCSCPCDGHAHDDRNPSLSVGPGDSQSVVVFCHADPAHDFRAVCAALGLKRDNQPGTSAERVWPYRNKGGNVVFEVVRRPGKRYRLRHTTPAGETEWTLPTPGRGLIYRLPEIQKAIDAGSRIVIVEGERDADALVSLGVEATCNAGGANKWYAKHSQAVGNAARIVICGDCDKPGQEHVIKVAAGIRKVSPDAQIRHVTPEQMGFKVTDNHGLDIRDWLSADPSRGREAVNALLDAAAALTALQEASLTEASAEAPAPDRDPLRTMDHLGIGVRVLEHNAADILIASETRSGTSTARLLDPGTGLWRVNQDLWTHWIDKQHKRAWRQMVELLLHSPDQKTVKRVATYGRDWRPILNSGTESVRKKLEAARRRVPLEDEALAAQINAAVTLCDISDLDADTRYLGCANGVVDLRTGKLLLPTDAREHCITFSTGVSYEPEAEHPDVDLLLAHLDDEERRWWLQALGYALLGQPDRRFYLVVGPPAGGKTTLFTAVIAALGEYAGAAESHALTQARSPASAGLSPELEVFMSPRRVAILDDIPRQRIDTVQLKRLSGQSPMQWRRLHEQLQDGRPSATLFIACNTGQTPRLGCDDPALADRLRELPYPEVPQAQRVPALIRRIHDPDFLMALLARLVRECAQLESKDEPPDDCPAVSKATLARIDHDIGDIGVFMKRIRPELGSVMTSAQLWAAWCTMQGVSAQAEHAGGLKRGQFTRAVRRLRPDLPATTSLTVDGASCRGWRDWTLDPEPRIDETGTSVGGAREACLTGQHHPNA